MKALVLKEANVFSYEDVPTPEPGEGEVLIKIKACGICGSDVHGMDGSTGRRIPPIIMGHEASGVIEQLGSGVHGYKVGDRVTFDSTISCGECWFCRHGNINLCQNREVLGVSCDEYSRSGAFAEYVTVPQRILYPLADEVSFQQATMVEPTSVALHGIKLTMRQTDKSAVVIGSGIVGVLAIGVLASFGFPTVVAVDIDDEKLELAREFGASHVCNPKRDDPAEAVLELTDGRGADLSLEVVGLESTFNTALSCVRKGRAVSLIGNLVPNVSMPLQKIITSELHLQGSCASSGEFDNAISLIRNKHIDADRLISKTVPLSEAETWFRKLYAGEDKLLKVVVQP